MNVQDTGVETLKNLVKQLLGIHSFSTLNIDHRDCSETLRNKQAKILCLKDNWSEDTILSVEGSKKKKRQMIIGSLSVPAKSPINLPQNQIPLVWISILRKNERWTHKWIFRELHQTAEQTTTRSLNGA